MKKLLILALVATLAALAVPARASDEFNVSLDAWFVNIAGVRYLAGETWECSGPFSGNDCPTQRFLSLDGEGDVSPVLNFTWIRDNKHGLGVTYYNVQGDATPSFYGVGSGIDFYIIRATHIDCYLANCYDEWWQAEIEAEFMELDLRYLRVLKHESADTWWRAGFGLTIADFEQTDTQYLGWDNTNSGYEGFDPWFRVENSVESSGWGPSVVVEGSQRLGVDNFRFQGSLALAYLSGTSDYFYRDGYADWDGNEYYFTGATYNPYVVFSDSRDTNVMKMDIALGLEYEFTFGLLIRAGYRLTHWSNLPSLEVDGDEDYWNNYREDVFKTRDISTEGFYLGAGYSWGGK